MSSDWTFIEPSTRVAAAVGIAIAPYPVRREVLAELMNAADFDLQMLIEEIERYVGEHPQTASRYGPQLGRLAWVAGVEAGRDGYLDIAEHNFRTGLGHDPGSVSLRLNLALALQQQGRLEESLALYGDVLSEPQLASSPHLRVIAARLLYEVGDRPNALAQLVPLLGAVDDDDSLWNLAASFLDEPEGPAASTAVPQPPASSSPMPRAVPVVSCPACGDRVAAGRRFCTHCGARLTR